MQVRYDPDLHFAEQTNRPLLFQNYGKEVRPAVILLNLA